eukprot:11001420-Ditylum_brightwellii.AAC.1
MSASDIVNRNAQFLIGIKEAIQTTDIFKRIPCSVIGIYTANSFALANKFSPSYMGTESRRKGGMSSFVCDICIGQEGLFKAAKNDDDQLSGPPDSSIGVALSIDPAATDPY